MFAMFIGWETCHEIPCLYDKVRITLAQIYARTCISAFAIATLCTHSNTYHGNKLVICSGVLLLEANVHLYIIFSTYQHRVQQIWKILQPNSWQYNGSSLRESPQLHFKVAVIVMELAKLFDCVRWIFHRCSDCRYDDWTQPPEVVRSGTASYLIVSYSFQTIYKHCLFTWFNLLSSHEPTRAIAQPYHTLATVWLQPVHS